METTKLLEKKNDTKQKNWNNERNLKIKLFLKLKLLIVNEKMKTISESNNHWTPIISIEPNLGEKGINKIRKIKYFFKIDVSINK